ncbi:MAG: RNA polymerase sigma factor [Solirubrobacteraceae bacterium]|nr:RNA polymerase sigma factor [Solirubrobacteraceae bacterium]
MLQASRDGDAHAFEEFYGRHRQLLVAYLASRVREPDLAADLMAETFARALVLTGDPQKGLPRDPVAWLFVVARNLLIDGMRRGRVEAAARQQLGMERLGLDDTDIERIHEIQSATDLVRDLAPLLPAETWALLNARLLDEESYSQLAARLECSEAVVRQRVSRATSQLRTALGERGA